VTDAATASRRVNLALFVVGLAGSGLSLSGGVGTLAITLLSLLEGDAGAATLGAWASGAMLAMAACGIPAIVLGLRGLLGRTTPPAGRPASAWFAVSLLFPVALLAGTWVLARPSLTLLAIPVHIATAVLPVVFAVLLVRVPGPLFSSRRSWGQFLTGLWAMPPLAMVFEVVALIPVIAVTVAGLSTSPGALALLEPLLRRSAVSVTPVEDNAVRLLLNPWVLTGIFGFVSGLVPLIEEAVKSLSVVPIARRLSPAAAFAGGAVGGAGYALFEALFLTQPDPSWLTTMVGRGGATLMHAFTAAVTCWGVSQVASSPRRWGRLALAYLTAVSMHGLWNATAIGVGLVQVNAEAGALSLPAAFPAIVQQAGPILLAALSFVALVGLPLGAWQLTRVPPLRSEPARPPGQAASRGTIGRPAQRPPGKRHDVAMLRVGDQAPDFMLLDDRGAEVRLSGMRGRPVVLYFYPKDDTPGCTAEACGFRDQFADYRDNAIVVLGISPDTAASHARFRDKFSLPFPLLADEGHAVASAYGVWGPKTSTGRTYEGVLRTTFLIGPDGRLLRIYENVKPVGHSQQILADLLGAGDPA
jgi:peroxiredoxin Q/BCP